MEDSRHILLLFHHYRTPNDLGGLRSWHIGTHLAKSGYRVTAIIPGVDTLTGKKHPKLKGKLWYTENVDGVTVIRSNATSNDRSSKISRAIYYFSSSLTQVMRAVTVRHVDMIVCTSMPLSTMVFALLVAKLRRIPLIIDVRDLTIDAALELGYFKNNFIVRALLGLESLVFRYADCVVPVSRGLGEILAKKCVSRHKIKVIPLGYDGLDVYAGKVDWSRNIKKELELEDKFIVLYSGTLGHVFDVSTIIQAAQLTLKRKDIVYLFLGGGQKLKEYREYAQDHKLNCVFLGPRPKADVPLICTQADVCVYPGKSGAVISSLLGNKIFDYLGNGTPTIYTGPPGDVQNLIRDAQGGRWVPLHDAEALASSIYELADNPERTKILGDNAKEYIEREYTVKKMMAEFEQTINDLLV